MPIWRSCASICSLLSAIALAGCLGEEKPKCVPNPTLKCVTDAAIAALANAGSFAEYEDLATIARAQKKAGDAQGFERTLAYAQERHDELVKRAPIPESRKILRAQLDDFYVKAGVSELAKPVLEQTIAEARKNWDKPEDRAIESLAEALIAAGRAPEAKAALAEQHKWLESAAPTLKPDRLCGHAANLWRAYERAGDKENVRGLANLCWARLRQEPLAKPDGLFGFEGKDNVRDRFSLAEGLLPLGLTSPVDEVLADARKLLGPEPKRADNLPEEASNRLDELPRLLRAEIALSRLKKDATQEAAIIEGLRRLRAGVSPESLAEQLRNDARAMAEAGLKPLPAHLKEEAAALLEKLKSEQETRAIYFKHVAEVYALLGDETATRAVFAAMKTDANKPWEIADDRRDICVALARNGHVEGALACATALPGSKPYHKANTVAAYAAILEAMTKR